MKKFKVSFVAVFAILLGIAGTAFTNKPSARLTGSSWYQLAASADPSVASNYSKVSQAPNCPSAVNPVCAIFVPDNGTHPLQADVDNIKDATSDFTLEDMDVEYRP
jgi:hypothetical protein